MLSIHLSLADCHMSVLLLVGLGAAVGLLGGFFGVGGGWIVTPALNVFGLPMPYAVATGLGYVFGMTCVSGWQHRKYGHMDGRLGSVLGLSMIVGIRVGKQLMTVLEHLGRADPVVRAVYVVFLVGLGSLMLIDYVRTSHSAAPGEDDSTERRRGWLKGIHAGPLLRLPRSGITVSLWPLLGIGLGVGFLSGIMGVGGGFVLMPIMVYVVGTPTAVAVGTSLLCLLIASPFAVLAYSGVGAFVSESVRRVGLGAFLLTGVDPHLLVEAVHRYGRVEFTASGLMIVGALIGAPVGVFAGRVLHGRVLRLLYALMIIAGGIAVALKQFGAETASRSLILFLAVGMCAVILLLTALHAKRTGPDTGGARPGPPPSEETDSSGRAEA
ncbi:MAG: sulfite exporter TauE/SafE family protein [Kiritimatiellaeota bacterium]|nr:sulfite exporter TauE/SafE family protein [Kiritimatiellota bacterium]